MRAEVVFIDRNAAVVDAWKYQFEDIESPPAIVSGDIFQVDVDAILVPGNAFGFLDRGLELQACERYGFELQDGLRDAIRARFRGELLVGQALVLPEVPPDRPRAIVYSAQYRTPAATDGSLVAYLTARGAFLALEALEAERGEAAPALRVAVPGIGTGPGLGTGSGGNPSAPGGASARLDPRVSARQLRYAWEIFTGRRGYGDKNLTQLTRREAKLRRLPRPLASDDDDDGDGDGDGDDYTPRARR